MEKLDKILRVAASKTWKMHTPKSTHIQLFLECGSGLSKHAGSLSLTPPLGSVHQSCFRPRELLRPICQGALHFIFFCFFTFIYCNSTAEEEEEEEDLEEEDKRGKGSLFCSGRQRLLSPCCTSRLKRRPALRWAQFLRTIVFRAFTEF